MSFIPCLSIFKTNGDLLSVSYRELNEPAMPVIVMSIVSLLKDIIAMRLARESSLSRSCPGPTSWILRRLNLVWISSSPQTSPGRTRLERPTQNASGGWPAGRRLGQPFGRACLAGRFVFCLVGCSVVRLCLAGRVAAGQKQRRRSRQCGRRALSAVMGATSGPCCGRGGCSPRGLADRRETAAGGGVTRAGGRSVEH